MSVERRNRASPSAEAASRWRELEMRDVIDVRGPDNLGTSLFVATENAVRIHDPDAANVGQYAELTGLPFGVLHLETGLLTGELTGGECNLLPDEILRVIREAPGPHAVPHLDSGRLFYSVRLFGCLDGSRRAAGSIPLDGFGVAPVESGQPELLRRLLVLAEADVERVHTDPSHELDELASHLDAGL